MPLEGYYARMERFLEEIKASPRAKGVEEILYPGERRYRTYLKNAKEGVALPAAVAQELEGLAREYGVPFPTYARS
jgi:LDH2 family malate/lactate/ureidoglycolate dehydrogenase